MTEIFWHESTQAGHLTSSCYPNMFILGQQNDTITSLMTPENDPLEAFAKRRINFCPYTVGC